MNETWLFVILFTLLVLATTIAIYPFNRQHYRSQSAIVIVLIAGSTLGYWQWGSQTKWVDYLHQQQTNRRAQALMKSLKSPQELVDKLKAHLQQKPDSARGWYLLGRLYTTQNQSTSAFKAFFKAHELEPENEQITINYAQSIWQTHHQAFTPDVRQLFQFILKKNPTQPDALSMLAMDAYQQHEYQKAIDYWSSLLILLPLDSSESKAIRKAISKARNMIKSSRNK